MTAELSSDFIFGFVWRPAEIASTVTTAMRQAGGRAIFDLSRIQLSDVLPILTQAQATDIKLSAADFLNPVLEDILKGTKVKTLWVEYHPALFPAPAETFMERLGQLALRYDVVPVTGDLDMLFRLLECGRPPGLVAVKGAEASAFVSRETTGVLYGTLKSRFAGRFAFPDWLVWGGIGTPEAAAAFLACGARGLVCESVHWLTDLTQISDQQRQRLSRLRPEHSTVLGADLEVPCRVFNKGNSAAVKELSDLAAALGRDGITYPAQQEFAIKVSTTAVHALEAELDRRELVFLGPEAAWSGAFVERFGQSTLEAVSGFVTETKRGVQKAQQIKTLYQNSPAARELGVRYPFIQGAMSWISDVPEFALAVAEAGGLPTVALGMRNGPELERELIHLKDLMGTRPFALNFIALKENPYLEEQLTLIEKIKPPLAVIAAGDPSASARLHAQGIEVIYIAPDEGPLRLAAKAGVKWLILEGDESGGHVGQHSTLTLAQMVLELKRREPELLAGRHIILAGGIFNRQTAFWAAMLGAEAIQMGTVYLATEEIVATGALSHLYQQMIVNAPPGSTTVSGRSIGLGVRALKTPKLEAILALERQFVASGRDEATFRHDLEAVASGSLLLAAKGHNGLGGQIVAEEVCRAEGQFMSGAVAGAVNRIVKVADLHDELAAGELPLRAIIRPSPAQRPARPKTSRRGGKERIAITGLAVVNSLGITPAEVWAGSLAMKCGVTTVPATKWDHRLHYAPPPIHPEKTYCQFGAFINIDISRKELGIAPQDFRTMSNSTRLTMYLAQQAINAAGFLQANLPPERIGTIISQNSGESASTLTDLLLGFHAGNCARTMCHTLALTDNQAAIAEERLKTGRLSFDDTTLVGRLNSAAGGFIANKYGFRGPSYAVTAACASSLVALYNAIQLMDNGVIDAAVVGGGEETLTPEHFVEFSGVGSLAGISHNHILPRESCRPFDSRRDGMVLGEGGAMLVIERESVARKRGANILAFITGVGASNNDQGMVESLAASQEIAIRASFMDAGYSPATVDLVEAHATGTVLGDIEEVKALKGFFPKGQAPVLSAYKSQIGHTLGASGLNSLARAVMALQAGVFPGTLNYQDPDPRLNLEDWGFRVLSQPEDWPGPAGGPRRLMADAFGFGGANYVVQVEECLDDQAGILVSPGNGSRSESRPRPTSVSEVYLAMENHAGRPWRIGLMAASQAAADKMITGWPFEGEPGEDRWRRKVARRNIYADPADQTLPPLALMFAGQGTVYPGMGQQLYETFPLIRQWMDRLSGLADFDLLATMFEPSRDLQRTLYQQPALFCLEYALFMQMTALGLQPAAMAGHSVGEIVALTCAGVLTWEDGFRLVCHRAKCMDQAAGRTDDPGIMVATEAPLEVLQKELAQRSGVYFTNFNSPKQIVLGGATSAVMDLAETLKQAGFRAVPLKVSMAFHTPIMESIREDMAQFLATLPMKPPRVPVLSNTTMKPHSFDPEAIKAIIVSHLEAPVHWMQNTRFLWDDLGVRDFLEIGPGPAMSNLVADTLEKARCFNLCHQNEPLSSFKTATAQLYAYGHLPEPAPITPMEQAALATPRPDSGLDQQVMAVVHREVDNFVRDLVARFLKPAILETIRREVDPGYGESALDALLTGALARPATPLTAAQPVASLAKPLPSPTTQATPMTGLSQVPQTPAAKVAEDSARDREDHVERIISIIMSATGYERQEIDADMDLRTDLAIRSSRLPVIVDAAEKEFGIIVQVEDFVGVRTVRQLADRIAQLARQTIEAKPATPALTPEPVPAMEVSPGPAKEPETDTAATTYLERVIAIIMSATGYERQEIEADMDLRSDLAIRSSRLPVIIDSAEKEFAITVRVEDFAGVRTVRQLADRIAHLAGVTDDQAVETPILPPEPASLSHEAKTSQEPPVPVEDFTERVIAIIMAATGYERSEIEPDMDLRTDLAIRSSRLPVIVDAAEKEFGITVRVEDFAGVRTVRQLATRLGQLAGVTGLEASPVRPESLSADRCEPQVTKSAVPQPFRRLIFEETDLPAFTSQPLELPAGRKVIILTLSRNSKLTAATAEYFRRRTQAEPIRVVLDPRTASLGEKLAKLMAQEPLSGLVVVIDGKADLVPMDWTEAANIITTLFQGLQVLLRSADRRFSLLLTYGLGSTEPASIVSEGIIGLFLAAAQEYGSVLFRHLTLDFGDLKTALDQALDKGNEFLPLIRRGDRSLTVQATCGKAPLPTNPLLLIHPGDVIVVSGGGRGITAHLAKALALYKPVLILLGRSSTDSSPEVTKTLDDLAGLGVTAEYFSCDVSNAEVTNRVLHLIVEDYGRIDGIIHGAGVIRDAFTDLMTTMQFNEVLAVKLAGAVNLYQAAQDHGLRFMAALSSVTAITGNAGQANYCAANRAMSGFLRHLAGQSGLTLAKAMMLPPISGAGMADDPEVKALLKLKGLADAYIHVDELVEIFIRELTVSPPADDWVLLARRPICPKNVLMDLGTSERAEPQVMGFPLAVIDWPMIQFVESGDVVGGELLARRTFHTDYDLWLTDHQPFKFLKNPWVAGIMAVETFLEAAKALCPHLKPAGIKGIEFREPIECPRGMAREARILCRRVSRNEDDMCCQVTVSSQDLLKTGRLSNYWTTNFTGQVVLTGRDIPELTWPEFAIRPEELDSGLVSPEEVQGIYQDRLGHTGRFRVVNSVTGTGPGVIKVVTIAGEYQDLTGTPPISYHYSAYLLEALMQAVKFYQVLRDPTDNRECIPAAIGELYWSGSARPGDRLIVEGRLRSEDTDGQTWDGLVCDESGRVLMMTKNSLAKWFLI